MREEFRVEVLGDAVVLYAAGTRLKELIVAEPLAPNKLYCFFASGASMHL